MRGLWWNCHLSLRVCSLYPAANETLGLMGGTAAQPDFGMISAIYNGFRNDISWNSDEQVVNSVCTTGNCTWPAYTTAAVCNVCNDVSDHVKVQRGIGDGGANVPLLSNVMMIVRYTAFILPGLNLSNANGAINRPLKGVRTGLEPTLLTANTTFDPLETISFQDLSTMILSFKVMRASEEWMQGKVAWNASNPTATECALLAPRSTLGSRLWATRSTIHSFPDMISVSTPLSMKAMKATHRASTYRTRTSELWVVIWETSAPHPRT